MSEYQLTNRQRMVAALVALHDGDMEELAEHTAQSDAEGCRLAFTRLAATAGDIHHAAQQQIRFLRASEKFSGLAEIHPAWILEELKHEPPRVIGVILRHLPARHVRYVIEHLPLAVREALPEMIEVFGVQTTVLEVIRRRFERRFLPLYFPRDIGEYGFEHVYYLKGEELAALFRDLGIQEMAMALDKISPKTLRLLLNRFPLRDAKQMQARMRELQGTSDALRHQARFTMIGAAEKQVGAEQLVLDIGFVAFARALGSEHELVLRYIQQKLTPELSYRLKRVYAEWMSQRNDELAVERRGLIVERISALARERVIDPSWGGHFAQNDRRVGDRAGVGSER